MFYVSYSIYLQYVPLFFGDDRPLQKYLNPSDIQWSEVHYHAISCIEAIIIRNCNGNSIAREYIYVIKDSILSILSSYFYSSGNKFFCTKVSIIFAVSNNSVIFNIIESIFQILCTCLHILDVITTNKFLPHSIDFVGEILGVVQVYLVYGIKNYLPMKPQLLRPAVMNLPEQVHVIPKCKNLKNHKAKSKKQTAKRVTADGKNNVTECKSVSMYSSDSDTSDTESNNAIILDSKVRLETVRLLQALVKASQSREIFGFWPQIVATGSRTDARVLTRCILKESVSKVKQHMLHTLTELLIDAKPFLMHAEDVQHVSFVTFFGTVCLMIKELHFTLSFILNGEKNVAVLTHGLKCVAALIQGTPYARLKTGLATTLMRNCRPYIFHKGIYHSTLCSQKWDIIFIISFRPNSLRCCVIYF